MDKFIFLAVLLASGSALAATPSRSVSSSGQMVTGMAVGMAISSLHQRPSAALSSDACGEREFAVAECTGWIKDLEDVRGGYYYATCKKDGKAFTFDEVAVQTGLPNADVANVVYQDYHDKFLITICYGGKDE